MIEPLNNTTVGVEPPKSVPRVARVTSEQREKPDVEHRKPEKASEPDQTDVSVDRDAAAETIAKAMYEDFPSGASLDIEVNDKADVVIYKAVDPNTGEVLKQYPSAEVIERLERIAKSKGLAYDNRV